ncbi:MAG: hypothetical protein VW520_03935 [Candidatus Puniceispirillum sp.]|jgi:hypothetical protein
MIEVISVRAGPEAGHMPPTSDEAQLLSAAVRFFADRLLTRKQQRRLTFVIEFTAAPHRHPVDMAALIGENGLFGFRPPRLFEMTASSAAGMRDAFESVAVEMVHVAQVTTGRLALFNKKRKFRGARQSVIAARWLGKQETIVDTLARTDRPWVIEAVKTAPRLVNEFMALAAGETASLPRQKATDRQIGLHLVKAAGGVGAIAAATSDIEAPTSTASPVTPHDTVPADVEKALAIEARFDDSAAPRQSKLGLAADPIELPVGPEFSIAVPVAGFDRPRQLGSSVLFGKVNDLLERGLIMRDSAHAAIRLAESRRSQKSP